MKIYFPQWQGSGNGEIIKDGAKTILDYLNDPEFVHIDLSDIPAGKNGVKKHDINNYDAITEQLTRLKKNLEEKQPMTTTTIGGDCGLEIVPVSYLNKKYPNLGVIWFDAHADINKPCDSPSCNFHGMPLRTLLGEGSDHMDSLLFSTIKSSQIHYVGVRDIDDTEQIRINEDEIYAPKKTNIERLVNTLQSKKITNLYVHFDFDCLEPNDYDKTYYQVPDGVTISKAEECIKALQENFTVVGSSVLESITANISELQPIEGIINLLMKNEQ
ncbi:arginase family protein [Aquimarina sp. 2201CG14-23]|uniref:arginase family protein n=1 Tax=Aquimarina mycalae TaxID=3040073 RepID=UPI00247818BD|nr:arginase family protein [Aquimarina sp. 2201CG14-23]MDH7447177.1 arginase family protein [Aquimarina sp. 2201CG14-23]